ncbi:MAG: hypothetical protein QME81_16085, partial [bacterium]|nr:hypothetical protein [bacterium]
MGKMLKLLMPLIVWGLLFGCGPDLEEYQYLREPQIRTMPGQKMIIVEVHGDPNVIGKDAFPALFKTFYKLKGQAKGSRPPAPRARWPKPLDTPKDQWIGLYGLPISETVKSLPGQKEGNEVKIDYWEYGEVAEILLSAASGRNQTNFGLQIA